MAKKKLGKLRAGEKREGLIKEMSCEPVLGAWRHGGKRVKWPSLCI